MVILEVADRLAQVGHERPLVRGRQERGTVLPGALDQGPRADGDEAGQVLVLRAQAIGHPGAQARPRGHPLARVHLQAAARVVDVVAHHRADHAHVDRHTPRAAGNSSLTSRPDSPCLWNFQGEASRFLVWPR